MKIDMMRFRETFFTEAAEHLTAMEEDILNLNGGGDDRGRLDGIFRCAHSIKGGAGTFEFTDVTRFAHGLESLLDQMRTGAVAVTPAIIEALLNANDMLGALLTSARGGTPSPAGVDELLETLGQLTLATSGKTSSPETAANDSQTGTKNVYRLTLVPAADVFRRGIDPLLILRSLAQLGTISESCVISELPKPAEFDPEHCYFAWTLTLTTDVDLDTLRQEFAFYDDNVECRIETLAAAAPKSLPAASSTKSEEPAAISRPPSTTFFGAFLIERGRVTLDQVVAALDRQVASQIILGSLALDLKCLTVGQVFEALNTAWENALLFGEAAVKLGHLSSRQVADLIQLQRSRRKPIGAILVEMGAIDHATVEAEFALFSQKRDEVITLALSSSGVGKAAPQQLGENQEMLGDFIAEACDHLEAAEQHLLALEKDPGRRDSLDAIYRAFHTIKGISSFFNLQDITSLAHAAEDLLNVARDGRMALTGKAFELALASVDGLKRQVILLRNCLAQGGLLERDEKLGPLVKALRAAVKSETNSAATIVDAAPKTPHSAPKPTLDDGPRPDLAKPVEQPKASSTPTATVDAGKQEANRRAGDWAEKETVKVDRDRLDNLINVIGELVIAESMVGQEFTEAHAAAGRESVALPQLNKIVRDLQEMSLSLRMVPVGATFQKMNRIVRDVARRLGKQIQFHTQGEDTEIDKTVVDQIGDPLMHMVRNAADHGIESPEQRRAAGKSPEGHVTLRAFHQGGNIFIELEDDGKGLDRQAILKKAIERGLVSEGADVTDAEICDMIFKPGFSTAKEVTDVSGRGVGMDVVRRNVEALQGSVSVSSRYGVGSIVTIRLPLTLAIVDGLSVSLADQTYILPLVSVVESFRPKPSEVRSLAGGGEVIFVRGEAMPLVRLHRLFQMTGRVTNPSEGLVVIVEERNRKCALLVDDLLGQSQVVIKNLEANYRKVDGIAGATILGNGQVALILDVHGLSRLSSKSSTPDLHLTA